jgi:hypothetical protein
MLERVRRNVLRLACLVAMAAAGCAKPRVVEAPEPAQARKPARPVAVAPSSDGTPVTVPLGGSLELERIEQSMIDLDFSMRFDIESEGAVTSRLVGELRSQADTLSLRASGSFDGKPVELSLLADGKRLRATNGRSDISVPQPPELERAVVIGLVRMGLLHNLAMLVVGRPPDHADGGVDEWVRAEDVYFGAKVGPSELGADAQRRTPEAMSFRIHVGDNETGEATLWYDTGFKLPIERHQVVHFPEGPDGAATEMRVRETYTAEALRREG